MICNMKKCNKCEVEKPMDAFSVQNDRKDGRRSICKECVKIYNRVNSKAIHDQKMEYFSTESGAQARRGCADRYRKKFPKRHKAIKAVAYALKTDRLPRPSTCSECGEPCKPDAHHWSYLKRHWLDVVWLCRACHFKEHDRIRRKANQSY